MVLIKMHVNEKLNQEFGFEEYLEYMKGPPSPSRMFFKNSI